MNGQTGEVERLRGDYQLLLLDNWWLVVDS